MCKHMILDDAVVIFKVSYKRLQNVFFLKLSIDTINMVSLMTLKRVIDKLVPAYVGDRLMGIG